MAGEYVLTPIEAKILKVMPQSGDAAFYELATDALLTAGEVWKAMASLTTKGLLSLSGKEDFVQLTADGKSAQQALKNPRPDRVPKARVLIYDRDDPEKGKWGMRAEDNHRKVIATVIPDPADNVCPFDVHLKVISTDPEQHPLQGEVVFYLHPSYAEVRQVIQVKDGTAELDLPAWGASTVGVQADGGLTRLELDMAEIETAPAEFRVL